MPRFYGQRTCTLNIIKYLPDSYNSIIHDTVSSMLHEKDLLSETGTIQISFCHRYASICFTWREILEKF